MSKDLKSVNAVLDKITNYNGIVDSLHSIFNEEINEIINALLFKNSVTSFDSMSENDKLLNRMFYLIGVSYYGWFENPSNPVNSYNKINIYDNNPNMMLSYEVIKRIMENDYKQCYGACYKTGHFNIIMYINLVIKILEDKVHKINEYIIKLEKLPEEHKDERLYSIINENTESDLNTFNRTLNTLIEFRYEIILDLICKLGIDEAKKNKLITLLSKANELRLTEEDKKILSTILSFEQISNIIDNMNLYQCVEIKSKQLQKSMSLKNT